MSDLIAQPAIEPRADVERSRLAHLATSRLALVDLPMVALGVLAAALYLVNLTVSGYANTYYAMAAQAASQSWSAWFFGALDASSFITLDKPPLATMLMGLSVKTLGLSAWSILLPQALLGVGSVLVLYLAVRRSFGRTAALIAGVVMALTPVAALIFRYDNPDALLTFLIVSAAWALGRCLEHGRLRWAILAGALVGAAFLTKYLQAYLVLPAFALVWLVSAPVSLRRRLGGLLAAGLTVALASGWWVAIVELLPASARPYIGGSTTNSALELLLGYDGLGRIFGGGRGPAGTGLGSSADGLAFNNPVGRGGPSFGGDPGLLRLFNDQFGGQVAWLLPAALLALAVGLIVYRRAARTHRRVAGYLLWGGWLTVHVGVFSFMSGIIHPYYTVALAPAISALVGGGASELWNRRSFACRVAGPVLGLGVLVTGITGWLLLERTPDFAPGLGIGVLALSVAAAIVIAIPAVLTTPHVTRIALAGALVAALAGPTAYSLNTMSMSLAGGDPSAGPAVAGAFGRGGGGIGGDTGTADPALVEYLLVNQGSTRWIVAAPGSQTAAGIQLAADEPVMAMGGFSGGDPAPTLDQLKAYIASGELRYVLLGGGGPGGGFGGGRGGGGPGGGDSNARTAWITATCTPVAIAGVNADLYDCATAG
jgi:4-amino-4-deoxy-L-arabinose transferase-like glycosyltransferase